MKGWIYIAKNELFPELKVGFTDRHPETRVAELSGTNLPKPYVCVYGCLCDSAEIVERKLHDRLNAHRTRTDREFFLCSAHEIVDALEAVIKEHDILVEHQIWYQTPNTPSNMFYTVESLHSAASRIEGHIMRQLKRQRQLAIKHNRDGLAEKIVDELVLCSQFFKKRFSRDSLRDLCLKSSAAGSSVDCESRESAHELLIRRIVQNELPSLEGILGIDISTGLIFDKAPHPSFLKCSVCSLVAVHESFSRSQNGVDWAVCGRCGCTFKFR